MSVPVYRRSENKLDAYVKTKEMVKYTMHMIENEKLFPKKSRWNLASKISDNCLDSITKIRQANKIQPKTAEQAGVSIPTVEGSNVIDVLTTLKPSEIYLKYKGRSSS